MSVTAKASFASGVLSPASSDAAMPRRVQQFAVVEAKPNPQTGLRGVAIIVASVFAMLVDGTASNIINAGLPYLQGVWAATPDQASWIVTAFNAPYYATILLSPWLIARVGRKALLIASLLGFAATSFLLASTHSLEWAIVLRALQGACLGAVFVPAAILLFTSLPLALLPLAPPFFATVVLGASTLGSVIGGYFSETYGGDAVYLPGAIATVLAASLVFLAVPRLDTPQKTLRPDLIGYALSLIVFTAMQYLANEGERRNWFDDPSVPVALTILLVAGAVFVAWELFGTSRPHVHFRLLVQKRNLAVGAVINVVLGVAGYSVIIFTLYLQTQIAATATLAGELILLRFVTYVIGIIAAFALVRRRVLTVPAVMCIAAVGCALTFLGFGRTMTTTADAGAFVTLSLLFGLSFSMVSQPVPALVLGSLPLTELPLGLALYKVSLPVGLMIGTASFQTMLDHRAAVHVTELAGAITRARIPVTDYLQAGGKIAPLAALVYGQAQSLSFQDVTIAFAAVVLLVIPPVFFADLRPGPSR